MKWKILQAMLLAAVGLVPGSAAYAQDMKLHATVPFNFVLDDKVYTAGEYTIQTAAANTFALSIKNEVETTRVLVRSYPCTLPKVLQLAAETKLVFHRVNDTYFLYQVWSEGSSFGRQFSKSRAETQMARNGAAAETVIVAAKNVR
jgi:hypothetical protein